MDISTLIELYGLPGLIIGGLAWWGRSERTERREERDKFRQRIDSLIDASAQREVEVQVTLTRIMDLLRQSTGGGV